MKICLNPQPWNKIHAQLVKYAESHACIPPEPPIPLLLSGWAYSNDIEKKARWEETIEWVNNNSCQELVENIPSDQFYFVDEPTSYMVSPTGGPMYNSWSFESKYKPSSIVIDENMKRLLSQWSEIVGEDLAKSTYPLKFTGDKARRLLVSADSTSTPPWGSWIKLSDIESERRTFTKFRASINKAVAPHEVDHIDFITE